MENLGQGLGSVGKAHAFCISFIYDVLGKIIAILELKLTKNLYFRCCDIAKVFLKFVLRSAQFASQK